MPVSNLHRHCVVNPLMFSQEEFQEVHFVPDHVFGDDVKVRGYAICCERGVHNLFCKEYETCSRVMRIGQDQRGVAVHMWEPILCCLQDPVLVIEVITYSSPMEEAYYAGVSQLFDEVSTVETQTLKTVKKSGD